MAFGTILLTVLALRLQNQIIPRFEANEKVGYISFYDASINVLHLKVEMVVFDPSGDVGTVV